jgi:hypothetical protein
VIFAIFRGHSLKGFSDPRPARNRSYRIFLRILQQKQPPRPRLRIREIGEIRGEKSSPWKVVGRYGMFLGGPWQPRHLRQNLGETEPNTAGTVAEQWRNSGGTVAEQWRYSGGTVPGQSRNNSRNTEKSVNDKSPNIQDLSASFSVYFFKKGID